jgi:hypothetical protein
MRSFVVEGELISDGISSMLAINRKATKDLGTPATVLARADEAIE